MKCYTHAWTRKIQQPGLTAVPPLAKASRNKGDGEQRMQGRGTGKGERGKGRREREGKGNTREAMQRGRGRGRSKRRRSQPRAKALHTPSAVEGRWRGLGSLKNSASKQPLGRARLHPMPAILAHKHFTTTVTRNCDSKPGYKQVIQASDKLKQPRTGQNATCRPHSWGN